ncbi:MAG: ABC transporter ATP-binding protein/permease [Atopobiaceae bacterium]|nr:ABC transporter ATP-binding protein/permease [Atopobiaceae bacterium]
MIEIRNIAKSYRTGDFVQRALDDISITFRDNEFVAVLGPSGSGKTTMLNVLGGLDHADSGDLVINGTSTAHYRDSDWDTYRNHRIGFIFQSYNLIPHQTILSNVELALTLAGIGSSERKERAREALGRVGLAEHVDKLPSQLSGGQMQRVAIARALVNDPDILLADEPTGALDTETGLQVMDLLKEIADERLVVMVTHNPELAEQYATRIVRLADGRIIDDSDPYDPTDEEVALQRSSEGPQRRASMSFLTALALSFNNLMTKKGRTFLTAFAGSIGIIGIAAILALSNGVNDHIARTEEEAMSSYPLSISESAANYASLMVASMDEDSTIGAAFWEDPSRTPAGTDLIPETTIVSDMFAHIDSNDLTSFKEFLDSGDSGIESHVNDIVYNYGIYPRFYRSDTSDGVVELGASFSSGGMNSMMSALSSLGMSGNGSTSFTEMLNNRELLESQYDVIAGRWPSSYDEVVLVLSSRGRLTDFTLYDLGILDPKEFQEIVESVSSEEEYTIPDTTVELTYDDALGLTFRAVVPAECYRLSETGDTWTDMSDDEAFMRGVLDSSVELRVVGVIRPSETTDSPTMSEGIAYTHELTEELIRRATSTEIVQQQLADPDVDVFTGETFESLRDGTADAFQLDDLFTVDQEALENAFDFDSSALSGLGSGLDLSDISIDPSALSFDPSKIQVDTSSLSQTFDNDTLASLLAGVPAPDLSDLQVSLDAAQMAAISNASTSISAGFIPWLGENHPDVEITEDTDLSPYIQEYLATEQVQAMIAETGEALGPEFQEQISLAVERYLSDQVAPYLQGSLSELAAQAAQAMTAQLAVALQQQMASATQSIASQLSQQIGGALSSQMSQLSSALEGAFSVDADAFSNAIQFNMDAEDLTSLLTNYAQASQLTLDNNLIKLGYADFDRPRSIDIYPVSFDDKEAVLDIIDTYNEQMVAEGREEQKITYTDIMGALLSSVSDIVNTISTVLIAFVSISLVVSSIMIGIITYISVLERKKEIGILRAMGASKGNVANVFNAETFIEGLIAGIFAIAVVLAASVPVNAYILETRNVPNIMQLPAREALILIGISVGLTVLAGLIPSSAASRRDPVEALRSE